MPKLTYDEFLDAVRRSGLIAPEGLSQALAGGQETDDSAVAGSRLVEAGLLTPWQNERLQGGKWKGFFLGKYKVLHPLGAGGMGAVYLAEHTRLRHRVAVKVLSRRLQGVSSFLQRFHQEASAAARLNHPNIVRAYDADSEGDLHYFVMEYVEGTDLQTLAAREGPLPCEKIADYLRQAADALGYAHQSGLIHRDVKPSNLFLDRQGLIKVLDLGLAKVTDNPNGSLTLAYDERMIGTVDFLAPEQALNSHHIDGRADIYSLGCTLYYLLTGRPPFPDGTLPQRVILHQTKEPQAIQELRPDAPDFLVELCTWMMAKAPEQRPQQMSEIAAELQRWLRGERAPQATAARKASLATAAPPGTSSPARAPDSPAKAPAAARAAPSGSESSRGSGGSSAASGEGASADDFELVFDEAVRAERDTDTRAGATRVGADRPAERNGESASPNRGPRPQRSGAAPRGKPGLDTFSPRAERNARRASEAASSGSGSGKRRDDPFDFSALLDEALPPGASDTQPGATPRPAPAAVLPPAPLPPAKPAAATLAPARYVPKPASGAAARDSEGGLSYSLWFLLFAGIFLGLLLVVVGVSAAWSCRGADGPDKQSGFEGNDTGLPGLPAPVLPAPADPGGQSFE